MCCFCAQYSIWPRNLESFQKDNTICHHSLQRCQGNQLDISLLEFGGCFPGFSSVLRYNLRRSSQYVTYNTPYCRFRASEWTAAGTFCANADSAGENHILSIPWTWFFAYWRVRNSTHLSLCLGRTPCKMHTKMKILFIISWVYLFWKILYPHTI